jgi:hypothetical protein
MAFRGTLELAIADLINKGSVRELSPPCEWRIHPSTESRGSGFQHERLVWGINDGDEWTTVKIRQHAQDSSRTARRTGFEGVDVAVLNSDLTELLRPSVRHIRRHRDKPSPSSQDPTREEESTVHAPASGAQPSARVDGGLPSRGCPPSTGEVSRRYKDDGFRGRNSERGWAQDSRTGGEPSAPSTDEAEEIAAITATDRDLGCCPTPGSSFRPQIHSSRVKTTGSGADSWAAKEADTFIASILHDFPDARAEVAPRALPAIAGGTTLDSWENYMEKPVI